MLIEKRADGLRLVRVQKNLKEVNPRLLIMLLLGNTSIIRC